MGQIWVYEVQDVEFDARPSCVSLTGMEGGGWGGSADLCVVGEDGAVIGYTEWAQGAGSQYSLLANPGKGGVTCGHRLRLSNG